MAKDTGTKRIEDQLTRLHEKLESNNSMTTDIRICIVRIQEHLEHINKKIEDHSNDIDALNKDIKQVNKEITDGKVVLAKYTGGGAAIGSGITGIVILILKIMGWL